MHFESCHQNSIFHVSYRVKAVIFSLQVPNNSHMKSTFRTHVKNHFVSRFHATSVFHVSIALLNVLCKIKFHFIKIYTSAPMQNASEVRRRQIHLNGGSIHFGICEFFVCFLSLEKKNALSTTQRMTNFYAYFYNSDTFLTFLNRK